MTKKIAALLAHYRLEKLPVEGTFYRNTYRAKVLTDSGLPTGTAIIGLYTNEPKSLSLFHKLTHDEVWHFYHGDPFELYLLHPDGSAETVTMGSDFAAGQRVQFTVPAHTWQAARLLPGGEYALFGCTVAPGFTPDCFTGGTQAELLKTHPRQAQIIEELAVAAGEESLPAGFKDA